MSLNFLKNLFNFGTEKKPKRDMSKFGVFIRNGQNDGEIIDGCIRFHQEIKSEAKIVAVKKNEACKGMEVFFNSGSGVLELLRKKYLSGSDGVSTIHSLTTALSLHDAFPSEEDDFKQAVRSQILSLSSVQVLDVLKVPFNWEYPDIGSGKWIIVLDIPEVDDMDVFKKMGLPDNMVMEFPSNGDRYCVKFYCRLCQKDGHVQFRCLGGASDERPSSSSTVSSLDGRSNNTTPTKSIIRPSFVKKIKEEGKEDPAVPINLINKEKVTSKVRPEFRIRDISEEREESIPKPNLPALPQEAIEEFEEEIGKEEVQRYYAVRNTKQEKVVAPSSSLKRPSSTTTDKEPEIVFVSEPYGRQNPPDNSPVVTTTHPQSEASVKMELPITDEEDSNPAPKRRKKASPMLQVVIPENIRAIINALPEKVLNIQQLEAFFNHVKKKSRPADFARMYTDNVEGLYGQLSEISRRYYLRPIVGSNDDLKFVKMLGNVIQRFHNGPAKRRSDAKT